MVIPFTWHMMGATLGKQTSRQREKRSRLLRRAHSDKGAVVSSQLLFAAKGLDLCLEVGGPRLTGKHQLGGKAKRVRGGLANFVICERVPPGRANLFGTAAFARLRAQSWHGHHGRGRLGVLGVGLR